jgi:hypothetical protein
MKWKLFLLFIVTMFVFTMWGQEESEKPIPLKNGIIIGVLQGGGSLLGIDYEALIFDNFGIQIGGGYIGVGGGLVYHFENTVYSSGIWAGVWNQGIPGNSLSSAIAGITVFGRVWNWLHAQIGIGYIFY